MREKRENGCQWVIEKEGETVVHRREEEFRDRQRRKRDGKK